MCSGCTTYKPPDSNCVPVHIDKKYSVSGGSCGEDSIFVDFCGVAIVDEKAYLINDKEAFETIIENTTVNIAIGASGGPSYNYIYRVCD